MYICLFELVETMCEILIRKGVEEIVDIRIEHVTRTHFWEMIVFMAHLRKSIYYPTLYNKAQGGICWEGEGLTNTETYT